MPYKKNSPKGRPRVRALTGPTTNKREAAASPPLLVERREACRLLSISVATALRLEKLGILTPRKLDPKTENGKTFYPYENVVAVANGEADEADHA